jgi:hypothetical protein
MDLINANRDEKWGLYAFGCDESQEVADWMRGVADALEGGADDILCGKSKEEIKKLSNMIEDGFVRKDCYGDPLGVMDLDDVIKALHQEQSEGEFYRRYEWALALLTSIRHTFEEGNVKVLAYGH